MKLILLLMVMMEVIGRMMIDSNNGDNDINDKWW